MLEVDATPCSPTDHTVHQGLTTGRSPSPKQKPQAVDAAPSVTIRHDKRIRQLNDVIDASIAVEKKKVQEKKLKAKEKAKVLKAKAARMQKKRKTQLKGVSRKSKKVTPAKQKKSTTSPKVVSTQQTTNDKNKMLGDESTLVSSMTNPQAAAKLLMSMGKKQQVKRVGKPIAHKGRR